MNLKAKEVMLIIILINVVIPFLCVFSKPKFDTMETKPQEKNSQNMKQKIRKCCPLGSHMDIWYNCTEEHNAVKGTFIERLLEIRAECDTEYVVSHNYDWRTCPMKQREEFEVVHITNKADGLVHIFDQVYIDYDVYENGEINLEEFQEVKYSCLELSKDSKSLIALVCKKEEDLADPNTFLHKCCPLGQMLSRNYSSCVAGSEEWIPPRKVVHHNTEKMTGNYQLRYVDHLCTDPDQEIQIIETAEIVTTDGQFFRIGTEEPPDAYHCVDALEGQDVTQNGQDFIAIVCLHKGCSSQPCVSKCCHEKELLGPEAECVPANDTDELWTYHDKVYTQDLQLVPFQNMQDTVVEYSNHFIRNYLKNPSFVSNCDKVIIIDEYNNETVFILQNGSLYEKDNGTTSDYCVDNIKDNLGNVMEVILKCVNTTDKDINSQEITDRSSCIEDYREGLRILNTTSCIISCIFLIITFLVYISVPELNNLHGKIIISNILSIFLLTIYLLTVYNGSYYLQGVLCNLAGYTGYFLTISMFMWMTVMSFDLCWTFRRTKAPRKGSAAVKFALYSAIAWGSSLGLTICIILTDVLMEEHGEDGEVLFSKPNVGTQKCFLHDRSQGLYLHLPIMILMIVNGVFFILTILSLHR